VDFTCGADFTAAGDFTRQRRNNAFYPQPAQRADFTHQRWISPAEQISPPQAISPAKGATMLLSATRATCGFHPPKVDFTCEADFTAIGDFTRQRRNNGFYPQPAQRADFTHRRWISPA